MKDIIRLKQFVKELINSHWRFDERQRIAEWLDERIYEPQLKSE